MCSPGGSISRKRRLSAHPQRIAREPSHQGESGDVIWAFVLFALAAGAMLPFRFTRSYRCGVRSSVIARDGSCVTAEASMGDSLRIES